MTLDERDALEQHHDEVLTIFARLLDKKARHGWEETDAELLRVAADRVQETHNR